MKRYFYTVLVIVTCCMLLGCTRSSNISEIDDTADPIENNIKKNDVIVRPNVTRNANEHTINILGNVKINGKINKQASLNNYDYGFLFENLSNDIKNSELTVLNQSTPISPDENAFYDYRYPAVSSSIIKSEFDNGIDILVCSGYDSYNCGSEAISTTYDAIENNKLTSIGINKYPNDRRIEYFVFSDLIVSMQSYSVAFNNNEAVTAENAFMVDTYSDDVVRNNIAEASENSDIVIVFINAGNENTIDPSEEKIDRIDNLIDCGADIIICSGDYTIQPYDIITTKSGNTGLVYYNIGNYASTSSKPSRLLGGIASFTIGNDITREDGYVKSHTVSITDYDLIPVVSCMHNNMITVNRLDACSDDSFAGYNDVPIVDLKEIVNTVSMRSKIHTVLNKVVTRDVVE